MTARDLAVMLDMTARYLAVIPYPLSSPVPAGPHHAHQGPIEIIPSPATIPISPRRRRRGLRLDSGVLQGPVVDLEVTARYLAVIFGSFTAPCGESPAT
jgi:hypothetical protein